jgi:glycosyltransferase involved in cell wall biosynthesis
MTATEPEVAGARPARGSPAVCTIIARNYIAYAKVLAASYLEHHPDGRFYVLVVDGLGDDVNPQPGLHVLGPEDMTIPYFQQMCMQYDVTELCTAVKPSLLKLLLERYQEEAVVYLDPDIMIMRPLVELQAALECSSIVLIPHLLDPIPLDGKRPSERDILIAGAYNLGFIALKKSQEVDRFLSWWEERLADDCRVDVARGLFVDQKWIDLIPGLFDSTTILRDETYDVAYWNLHSRSVRRGADDFLVNGRPLAFFHFSGFDPDERLVLSRHQDRVEVRGNTALADLLALYADELERCGHAETRTRGYGYGALDNGVPVRSSLRMLYQSLDRDDREAFGDPFSTDGPDSFFSWAFKRSDEHGGLSPVLLAIHAKRADLARAFPEVRGRDRDEFLAWARSHAEEDEGYDLELLGIAEEPTGVAATGPFTLPEEGLGPFLTAVYRARPDVAVTFPDVEGRDRQSFLDWARTLGAIELGYDPRLAEVGRPIPPGLSLVTEGANGVARFTFAPVEALVDGINVVGYLRNETGVGEAARGYVEALHALNVPVALRDVSVLSPNRSEDRTFRRFDPEQPYGVNLVCVNADQHHVVSAYLGEEAFRGRYNIGVWFWELSDFPAEWHDRFSYYDEIWAASSFIANAIAPVSPIPVVRIPPAISRRAFGTRRRGRDRLQVADEEVVYLFVFDFHSYVERKNPLGLIDAFTRAFSPTDPAHLVIKCVNESTAPEAFEEMVDRARGHRVSIHTGYWSPRAMRDLMAACDVYVSMHRSEGLGVPMADAMLLGKPVVGTGWSANTDFMNVSNSFPVRYELIKLEESHGPYRAGDEWANPSVRHAAELMRYIFDNPEAAREIAKQGKRDIQANYSKAIVARMVRQRLRVIGARIAERQTENARARTTTVSCPSDRGDDETVSGPWSEAIAGINAEERIDAIEAAVYEVREALRQATGRLASVERSTSVIETQIEDLAEAIDEPSGPAPH